MKPGRVPVCFKVYPSHALRASADTAPKAMRQQMREDTERMRSTL